MLVLARREVRCPGAAAADQKVSRLRDLLWGGASDYALAALTDMTGQTGQTGPGSQPKGLFNRNWARLQAAVTLAGWWAFHGDPGRALQVIQTALARTPPAHRHHPEQIIPLAVLLQQQGQATQARVLIAPLIHPAKSKLVKSRLVKPKLAKPKLAKPKTDPDIGLVWANLAPDDATRLTRINQIFADRGMMPLALRDPAAPLSCDNLQAAGAMPRPADRGKVSVILPAFQAQDSIATALAGLCAQSYANLEIVVVDDASQDATCRIVDSMAQADPRIVLRRLDRNGGAYRARNCGLQQATGQFITTHDADDWSHPQKIETQIRHLMRHPGQIGVITHWARCQPSLHFTTNWRLSHRLIDWSHSSLLLRRGVFDRLGGWEEVRVAADTEFIWRIEAAYGAGSVARLHPDLPLAFARDAQGSLTRQTQTHARTIYFGLRHYYREISRYWQARYPQGLPAATQAQKRAMLPAALFGPVAPPGQPGPKIVLCGDLGNPAVIRQARLYLDQHPDQNQRFGISHIPDPARFRPTPTHAAQFCEGFFTLLQEGRVQIVLPDTEPDIGPDTGQTPAIRISLPTPGVSG